MTVGDEVHSRRSYRVLPQPMEELWLRERLHSGGYGLYGGMLLQDMTSVLPYQALALTIDGTSDPAVLGMIGAALHTDSTTPRAEIHSGFEHFVRQSASWMVVEGPLTYEIDYVSAHDADADAAPLRFELDLVAPGSFDRRFGRPIQYVPRQLAAGPAPVRRSIRGRHFVSLDEASIVTFRLPEPLHCQTELARHALSEASRRQGSEIARTAAAPMEAGGSLRRLHTSEELVAKYTVPIGWDARWTLRPDRGDRLDGYMAWRHLEFVRFRVSVRDAILSGINEVLRRAGARMGFTAQLRLAGVTNLDVDNLEELFQGGHASMSDAFKLWP